MSGPAAAVDVVLRCRAWPRLCPGAPRLARAAGRRAAARGIADRAADRAQRPPQRVELAIALADDAEVAGLNSRFRGRQGPTDVLSFPAAASPAPLRSQAPLPLGDVVLALETVLREAAEQHKPVADHLTHLVVHGVLHLIGYDHGSSAEARRMEALEVSILAELGVPDPYRDAE